MQFLNEYKMDFLKHRRIAETVNDLSDKELEESAYLSLNFINSKNNDFLWNDISTIWHEIA